MHVNYPPAYMRRPEPKPLQFRGELSQLYPAADIPEIQWDLPAPIDAKILASPRLAEICDQAKVFQTNFSRTHNLYRFHFDDQTTDFDMIPLVENNSSILRFYTVYDHNTPVAAIKIGQDDKKWKPQTVIFRHRGNVLTAQPLLARLYLATLLEVELENPKELFPREHLDDFPKPTNRL